MTMYFASGIVDFTDNDRRYRVMSQTPSELLQMEQKRVREVREAYCEIGPAGYIGVVIIDQALAQSDRALASDDMVAMLKSYNDLRGIS